MHLRCIVHDTRVPLGKFFWKRPWGSFPESPDIDYLQITSFSGSFSLFSLLSPHSSFNFRSKKALFISLFNNRLLSLPSPLFMPSTHGRVYLPDWLKARYGLSLRTDVSKTLYKRVCILPRQITSNFCSTEIPGGYSIYLWVGRCGSAPHTLTLFKTIQKSLIFLPFLRQNSDFWYPV